MGKELVQFQKKDPIKNVLTMHQACMCYQDPRKSPKGCAPIPDKILEFWPEVPIYSDKICKILDKVCAKIRIKFC